eukprot:Hpha_TRINITY_DN17739_c0_g1::TRINITY_DN17739_c0_g1_i1::g.46400::m.46400
MRAWHKQPEPAPLGRLRREDVLPPRPRSGCPQGEEIYDPAAEVARRAAALRFVVLDKELERDRRARDLRSKAELLRHYPWRPLGTSGRAQSAPLQRTAPSAVPELVAPIVVPIPGSTVFTTRRRKAWIEDKQKPEQRGALGSVGLKPNRAVVPVSPRAPPPLQQKPYLQEPEMSAIPALQSAVHRSLGTARCDAWFGPGSDTDLSTEGDAGLTRHVSLSRLLGEAPVDEKHPLPGRGFGVVSAKESIRALLQEARLELRILERQKKRPSGVEAAA